jgi:hypothetical protein
MKGARCQEPVLDVEKHATLCGKLATTERSVSTSYGDETVALLFCDACAAKHDARTTAPVDLLAPLSVDARAELDARVRARWDAG